MIVFTPLLTYNNVCQYLDIKIELFRYVFVPKATDNNYYAEHRLTTVFTQKLTHNSFYMKIQLTIMSPAWIMISATKSAKNNCYTKN